MTLESALLTALSAVVSALVYICGLLWRTVAELRTKIEKLEGEKGENKGKLAAYENCPARECPFRGRAESAA